MTLGNCSKTPFSQVKGIETMKLFLKSQVLQSLEGHRIIIMHESSNRSGLGGFYRRVCHQVSSNNFQKINFSKKSTTRGVTA